MYSGLVTGTGTRYCPSIEDKLMRFRDKERHQLFIEPEGRSTGEMYVQGMSTSLPYDVQVDMLHTLPGLRRCEVMRPGYAIEYDCIDPLALDLTLGAKHVEGLYCAGQINGSSGYEEAAVQGFVAGVNAALKINGEEPMVLKRSDGYIGTLIDDLVTKGTNEPYRIMTSRSEYRLLLRQDNADRRLTPTGYELGLISQERYDAFCRKLELIEDEKRRAENTTIHACKELNDILVSRETSPIDGGIRLSELLRRPQADYKLLAPFDPTRPNYPKEVFEQVEIDIKYEGYIKRQQAQVDEMRRLEVKKIPQDIDYAALGGLRLEAVEKLSKIRPENVGQASRISGVSPADISVLLIHLERENRKHDK